MRSYIINGQYVVETGSRGYITQAGYLQETAAVAGTQTHYRFRTDANAADATPTWGANEDVDYNPAVGVNFRLRLQVQNDSASALSGSNWQVRMSRNAGAYTQVTNLTTGVTSADASSDADETPIRIPRL